MTKKILAIGFAALLTAMVVFAGGAALIGALFVDGDPKESQLPFLAFVPALAIAGILGWLGWRSPQWPLFAGVQMGIFAVIFGVLVALGF